MITVQLLGALSNNDRGIGSGQNGWLLRTVSGRDLQRRKGLAKAGQYCDFLAQSDNAAATL
jgi:hypothetical protein